MTAPRLDWLPRCANFQEALLDLRAKHGADAWYAAVALAKHDLDFVQTNRLDHAILEVLDDEMSDAVPTPLHLAILGSSTTTHLLPGLRIAALRRGIRLLLHECEYGQYRQSLVDPDSDLHRFHPDCVLFCLDARHVSAGIRTRLDRAEAAERLELTIKSLCDLWGIVKTRLRATVLQQTILPVLPNLMGSHEARLPGSPAHFVDVFNQRLREKADTLSVDLVSIDREARLDGIAAWHDIGMWHRAKQDIAVGAAPLYGDYVIRVMAAARGGSAKALVLDLDNTIWGGTIGDDGVEGISLGQGTSAGEAFATIQAYAGELEQRGILLAICSKNDDAVARRGFQTHPEMVLQSSQVSSFVANWEDKATNLRRIAGELNIGLDALVFVDDAPFERLLVRQALPMVAVPELPDDPALVVRCLSRAGYFEATALTADDRNRGKHYEDNRARRHLAANATDMESYLASLKMQLKWSYFDNLNLGRAVQLINKTNQFNLTTRRYTQASAAALIDDPAAIGITLRLTDRFGDNGIIGVVIARKIGPDLVLDTWLMSCRVLGRRVEQATFQILWSEAQRVGARALIGEYISSPKNGMVRDHYPNLGFHPHHADDNGSIHFKLDLEAMPRVVNEFISIERS
jgi:FkbH-like protein